MWGLNRGFTVYVYGLPEILAIYKMIVRFVNGEFERMMSAEFEIYFILLCIAVFYV